MFSSWIYVPHTLVISKTPQKNKWERYHIYFSDTNKVIYDLWYTSINSSNHCPVWQVVFQKSLPHWMDYLCGETESYRAGGRNRGHVGISDGEKWDYSQVRWIQDSGQKKKTECMVWVGVHNLHYTYLDFPPLKTNGYSTLVKNIFLSKQLHSIKLNNIKALTYRSLEYF